MARWVLLLVVVCASVAAHPNWPLGSSGYGSGNPVEISNRVFDRRLGNEILNRIQRGRAAKVSVEESRKLSYEQPASCNSGCDSRPPVPVVCAPQEVVVNGTCCGPFTATPTTTAVVAVSCSYVQAASIPGLTINTVGGLHPLFCNTGGSGLTPVTITVVSSQIDNDPPVTNPPTIIDQPFVEIDPNGLGFIGSQNLPVVNALIGVNGAAATTLRQTYSRYCLNACGMTSNTFQFTVEFGVCP
ncbi:hypothetical protein RvY_11444 [Ramazzottius varieornatus]|uniref:Pherophorin domain-containing protein n=1 Tax=Ramazzottius varieornatus TaxID=947166 RepID=A0A1D1VPY9_RAMVA|nr:hypothetical protein RvY_11444 [Ramazzottius varieornatus]